jgi:uncharacterized membrane protein YsdA (DUF1294 family)
MELFITVLFWWLSISASINLLAAITSIDKEKALVSALRIPIRAGLAVWAAFLLWGA